jgi:hypothetical protein
MLHFPLEIVLSPRIYLLSHVRCVFYGMGQIFLTNMLINDEFALFLLPCRMRHPDGSGQLLGGRSGRRGGSIGDTASASLVEPGAAAAAGGTDHALAASLGGNIDGMGSGMGSGGSVVCREFVLEAFVLPLRTMFAEALSAYALPALESERLHCVLDLDKTLLVSVLCGSRFDVG